MGHVAMRMFRRETVGNWSLQVIEYLDANGPEGRAYELRQQLLMPEHRVTQAVVIDGPLFRRAEATAAADRWVKEKQTAEQ